MGDKNGALHMKLTEQFKDALRDISSQKPEFGRFIEQPAITISDIALIADYLKQTKNTTYKLFDLLKGSEPYFPPKEDKKRARTSFPFSCQATLGRQWLCTL
jgi:hypothetical protein